MSQQGRIPLKPFVEPEIELSEADLSLASADPQVNAAARAMSKDFGPTAVAEARGKVLHSPLARQVAAHLEVRADRPDAQLTAMVADARAKLEEIEDKREKLEAFRDVELKNAADATAAAQARLQEQIDDYEKRITQMRDDLHGLGNAGQKKIIDINANVDVQVDALDIMESLHRNVLEMGAKNITPRKGKAKKEV